MLVNGNAITINTTMREARSVGAAKILGMWQESSVNLTPFGREGQYGLAIPIFKYFITGTGPISWLKLFPALKWQL